jgi:hypothetical protein
MTVSGEAVIVARCPLCGNEHRYNKGDASGAEMEEIHRLGFTDEWLPCQHDLPGNYWRVVVGGNKAGRSGKRGRKAPAS